MSGERILLVEDDGSQAKPFSQMLEYRGYTVRWAQDIVSATRIAREFDPHLVIVDLLLVSTEAEADGFDVITTLRSASFATQAFGIMVWTSHFVNAKDEIRALRSGADEYLRKDAEFGLIEARLEALLRRIRQLRGS
ncbi:hypothetical protein GCM10022251_49420 [Phytohabitans flavus]|uniref:Response regulatory domain-containing protein n=1 Tax=Phytohabitans flavus TaxID=1076124 RepID=A0A6F8XSM9_9ACTN|nr:response regulator [Phytohabitans flavus]BCB76799.1 hypothetical protein Pflav_032090 [Phytohabitans flavus]